jgi:Zn-dependent protease with chaperone function
MLLWQAIALAGGLSMIGAMLVWGLAPLGNSLQEGLSELARVVFNSGPPEGLAFWHVFALSTAALLGAHLVFTLLLTYARIQRQRRRHRELLLLLSSPAADKPGTLMISHPAPVAYCLPGGARSVTVLSDGLVKALDPAELRAVLLHENAHLSQRHHLLLWAFAAWRAALPWLPTSRLAQAAVNSLIEMLADDAALKQVPEPTLIKAIAKVAGGGVGEVTPVRTDDVEHPQSALETTASRLSRLITPQPALNLFQRALVLVACVLLLAVPTALLVVPGLWG